MFESLLGFINYKGEGNFNKAIGFLTSCKNMSDEALENDISSGLKNNLNLSYHHSLKKAMKYCCLIRFLHKMETCYFNLTVSPIERIYLLIKSGAKSRVSHKLSTQTWFLSNNARTFNYSKFRHSFDSFFFFILWNLMWISWGNREIRPWEKCISQWQENTSYILTCWSKCKPTWKIIWLHSDDVKA